MTILFYDLIADGHHSEYISHIVDYLEKSKTKNHSFIFIVQSNFSDTFPEISKKANRIKEVKWIEVSAAEMEKSRVGGLFQKSFSNFNLMDFYASKFRVDQVVLLYFNLFQLPLIFRTPKYSISGILFLQFYRMNRIHFNEKLKYTLKYIITKLYSNNKSLKNVFILNDKKTVSYLNKNFKTNIFKMLPDPVPQIDPLENFDIYKHYSIDRQKKIFLHIGSLGNRKGTIEVIGAVNSMNELYREEICILIVGKPESELEKGKIREAMQKADNFPRVQIILDDQFVSNEMMKSLFNQCNFVLLPYKNVESSSGILGHAIASNKPVISTGSGLLKELVENHQLGKLLKEVSSNEIVTKMVELLDEDWQYNNTEYLETHTSLLFVERLLCPIIKGRKI